MFGYINCDETQLTAQDRDVIGSFYSPINTFILVLRTNSVKAKAAEPKITKLTNNTIAGYAFGMFAKVI